eukprot:GHVU01065205.1.p2 GENE.GHVU01065205.1~~GHVU01065205.1.p2  ORF type:complete len:106 (-),score=9.33 GHVU01065205.1:868-1185(-)
MSFVAGQQLCFQFLNFPREWENLSSDKMEDEGRRFDDRAVRDSRQARQAFLNKVISRLDKPKRRGLRLQQKPPQPTAIAGHQRLAGLRVTSDWLDGSPAYKMVVT